MNESGTGTEFRLRSSWACLVTTALIYPALILAGILADWRAPILAIMLAVGVAAQALVLIIVHIYLALRMPQEPDDERDRQVLNRASSIAGYVLQSGVFLVLVLMITQAILRSGTPDILDLLPIYTLLAVWIASELVRFALTITAYRAR
ncbi:MAG: accessory gene regulator B family protein [Phycisphaerales bacterium]|nr:accessory gene regulator B family protein [Phycisphaerales bacterium]